MTTNGVAGDRRLALVVSGFLVVAAAVLLGRALLGQEALIGAGEMLRREPWRAELLPHEASISTALAGDTIDIWDPQRQIFADALLDGDLALWNPFPSGGAPLAAEPSTGTFSPFQLVYVALPDWYAPGVVKLLEIAACVGFSFLFLRAVGLGRSAAVVGGAVYAFNGFQLVWTNWPQTRVGALVPALFWAVERVLQRRDRASVALTAVVVAILLFEGFPTVALAALIAAAAYVVVRLAATADVRAALAGLRGAASTRVAAVRAAGELRPAILCAGGVALGIGLTAVQLLPFLARLPLLDLSRDQTPDAHFDALVAATLAAPNAFGAPQDGAFRLPGNYVESLSYVGAAACVLAVLALARRAPAGLAPGVRLHAALGALVAFTLMFVGGPVLAFAQNFPPLDTNNVGRLRALLAFFVAVLAAVGVEGVLRSNEGTRRTAFRLVVAGAVVVAAAGTWHVLSTASDRGYLATARRELLVAGLIAAAAAVVVVAARRWPARAVPAVAVLGVLVVGQGLAVWQPYLPTSDRDEWYPRTSMHRFLQENLGHERVATGDSTLAAGTTASYGIRTVTGHVFTQPTWRDLLTAVDPAAFSRSPTYSFIDSTAEVATSPVLDRLGARYFAVGEDADVLGVRQPAPEGMRQVELGPGDEVRAPLRAQRLRAIDVTLTEPLTSDDRLAWLRVEVRDPAGTVVARGARRILGVLPAGTHEVAVAAEGATADRPTDLVVEVTLDADDGRATLAADGEGRPLLGTVSGDDDLELVFSDYGHVYERSTALPRVRWASQARVEPDPDRRLGRLQAGLPDDTVLLDERGPAAREGRARVEVTHDGLDGVTVEVEADQPGYLVLADAVQIGWEARVDGEPVELRHADHALGAVHVPAGRHEVTYEFRPQRMGLGTGVSAVSLAVLVGVLAAPPLVRRVRHRNDVRPPRRVLPRRRARPDAGAPERSERAERVDARP